MASPPTARVSTASTVGQAQHRAATHTKHFVASIDTYRAMPTFTCIYPSGRSSQVRRTLPMAAHVVYILQALWMLVREPDCDTAVENPLPNVKELFAAGRGRIRTASSDCMRAAGLPFGTYPPCCWYASRTAGVAAFPATIAATDPLGTCPPFCTAASWYARGTLVSDVAPVA